MCRCFYISANGSSNSILLIVSAKLVNKKSFLYCLLVAYSFFKSVERYDIAQEAEIIGKLSNVKIRQSVS